MWVGWGDCGGGKEQVGCEPVWRKLQKCSGTRVTEALMLPANSSGWMTYGFVICYEAMIESIGGGPVSACARCCTNTLWCVPHLSSPEGGQNLTPDIDGWCGSLTAGQQDLVTSPASPLPVTSISLQCDKCGGPQPDFVAPHKHSKAETMVMREKGCHITCAWGTKGRNKASHLGWQTRWLQISINCLNPFNHVLTVGALCWPPPHSNLCPSEHCSIQRDWKQWWKWDTEFTWTPKDVCPTTPCSPLKKTCRQLISCLHSLAMSPSSFVLTCSSGSSKAGLNHY